MIGKSKTKFDRKLAKFIEEFDDEPPAPRAGESEQSKLFSRYTFAVVTGRYKILDNRAEGPTRIAQIATADGEEEARLIIQALNQHATLIEQRERLLQLLRPVTSPTACYCAVMKDEKCWHCEARELIATIEQETEVKSNTSGEAGR